MLAQRSKLARIVPSRSAVKAEEIARWDAASRRACPSGKAPTLPSSERQQRENTGRKRGRGDKFPCFARAFNCESTIDRGSRARGKSLAPPSLVSTQKFAARAPPRPPLHRLSTSTPVVPRNLGLTALIKHRATLAYAARSRRSFA